MASDMKPQLRSDESDIFDFHFLDADPNDPLKIRDVVLTAASQQAIREVEDQAKELPSKIRNDQERDLYIEQLGRVRKIQSKIKEAKNRKKEPFVQVNHKIETACSQPEFELGNLANLLKDEIARYEATRRTGGDVAQTQLLAKAEDEEMRAKYADNPSKKRAAKNRARQYRDEAAKVSSTPAPGIATHYGWRFAAIENQQLAMKTHPEFFSLDEDAIERSIRALEKAGKKVGENTFPGIRLEKYSWITYRR